MNRFVDFVLKNKLAIWLFTFIFLIYGVYSGSRMNLENLPNVELPYVVVSTSYPGASAETVDKEVSSKISNILENTPNIVKVSSTSNNNFSLIFSEFSYDTDIEKVKKDLEKSISKLSLPDNVGESDILEISFNSLPILVADISSENLDITELSDVVNTNLISDLNKIKGIGDISLSGLNTKKAVISYNMDVLNANGISKDDLNKIITSNSKDIPLGLFEFKDSEESVLLNTEFTDIKSLLSMKVPFKNKNGSSFVLSDLVSINELNENSGISRTNGSSGLSLSILQSNSANTVDVVNSVKSTLSEFNDLYKDVKISYVLDQGKPIEDSVSLMLEKLIFGAVIAVVIILLFLRDWRSTVIAVISIPLSLLISLSILYQLGITLNLMTLAAMTVAIGRVIDDSIVVVENIYRRLIDSNEVLYGRNLIKESTLQMFVPITSSTVVTVIVFVPLLLVNGMVGELFAPFALTMVFSLFASLLVAISVVPVLSHTLFKSFLYDKNKTLKVHKQTNSGVYRKVLEWSLNHKFIVLSSSIVLVGLSAFLLTKVGFNFMPADSSNQLSYEYEQANGETLKDLEFNLNKSEKFLLENDDIEIVKISLSEGNTFNPGKPTLSTTLTLKDDLKSDDLKDSLLSDLNNLGLSGKWVSQSSGPPIGGGGSNDISYSIYGNNVSDLKEVSDKLVSHLKGYENISDVNSTLSNVYKENVLTVNIDKASEYGITVEQLGFSLVNFSFDKPVVTLDNGSSKISIVERTSSVSYNNINDVLNRNLPFAPGFKVKDFVSLSDGSTLSEVKKENGRLVATVSGKLVIGNVSDVSSPISDYISSLDLPLGVEIDEGGVSAQLKESFIQLGLAMLAAVFLVYLSLVITFKEGLAPFVILMSLPFTIIGVVLILLLTNTPLDISGMLGLLMLIGIVVTNAIVMVDRILENEFSGVDLRESIIDACLIRLRPILMTAIATVATLLPLVFGESVGLIGKGLALTVIGGLTTSTLLTLIIVPILYELLSKLFRKDRKNIRHD